MIKKTTTTLVTIALFLLFSAPYARAVFCTAQQYVNPATDHEVWLFGDIHCDVDQMGTMTRLQQHTLLEEAQERSALIVAENINRSVANTHVLSWILPAGLDTFLFYKAINESSYKFFGAGALLTALHLNAWNIENTKAQKPAGTVEEHIKALQKNSPTTSLPCYHYSPLFNLVEESTRRGIPACNIEFRYHMLGALRETYKAQLPLLLRGSHNIALAKHWLARKVTGNQTLYPVTLKDYLQTNKAILQEIAQYTDKPLRDFYASCVATYEASYITQALRTLGEKNTQISLRTIIPTLVTMTGKDTAVVLTDFSEHNKSLFDARIMHTIYAHRNRTVFVCTGAYHIDEISPILEQLGYQAKKVYGKDNLKILTQAGVIGRSFIQTTELNNFVVDLAKVFAQA